MSKNDAILLTGSEGEKIRLIPPQSGKNASLTVDGETVVSGKDYNRGRKKTIFYDPGQSSLALELRDRGLSITDMASLPPSAQWQIASVMDGMSNKD